MAKEEFILEDPSGELTDRQKLFCHYYIVEKFNGTRAAEKAGYAKKTADQQASRLLTNVKISAFVDELKKDLGLRLGISRERVANELAKIGFADVRKIFTVDGGMMAIREIDDDTAGAIAGIEIQDIKVEDMVIGKVAKIKMSDKRAALADLNKMLGYNEPEKTETTLIGATVVYNLQPGNAPLAE